MVGWLAAGCGETPEEAPLPELPARPAPPSLGPAGEERPFRELVIALTGEVRGEIEPCGCPTVPYGGFARRAGLLDRLRGEAVPVFVLDAGAMLVRGQVARDPGDRPERARAVLDLAAAAGLDAWSPSPLDLQAGGLGALAGSGALVANWQDASGRAVFPGARVLERDGIRLGVVGLAGPAEGIQALDPVVAARTAMDAAGAADVWVALSNLPDADLTRVAEEVPGLGAVLATRGEALDAPRATKGALVVETPDRGRYVTVLRAALGSDGAAWTAVDGAPYADLARERERRTRLDAPEARTAAEARIGTLRAEVEAVARGHDLVMVENLPLGSDLDGPGRLDARIAAFKGRSVEAAAARASAAPETAGYTGASACMSCHDEHFAAWLLDPHARAYEALISRKQELNPECVGCHSTGWGEPGGNAALTPAAMRTWKAVQCEACHGPLAGHPQRKDVAPRTVDTDTCTRCHDPANSPSFDPAAYGRRISCARVGR